MPLEIKYGHCDDPHCFFSRDYSRYNKDQPQECFVFKLEIDYEQKHTVWLCGRQMNDMFEWAASSAKEIPAILERIRKNKEIYAELSQGEENGN